MTDIIPEEPEWTSENLQKLFSAMKSNIPSRFTEYPYTKGLKKVDWNKVAFRPFSPEACRLKWRQILQKMRRSRSLTELLVEAENNLISNQVVLKRPVPPSVMFYQDHGAKFKEQHPQLTHRETVRVLGQKYKLLPEKQKAQYREKYKRLCQDYRARKQQLREKTVEPPDNKDRRKKVSECVSTDTEPFYGPPPKPCFSAYILFCNEQKGSMAGVGKYDYVNVWAQRWRDLTDGERKKYQKRCQELKKEYEIKLDKYLKTVNQKGVLNESGNKRQRKGTTLTAAEQKEYRDSKPGKHRFLRSGMETTEGREALSPSRPSDSEDEDIEESSSDDGDDYDYFDCNEEEEEEDEEEEEEDDITFQMY